ncbi:MAG TPA: DoxX family protein, partial [Lacipirellula sp.]
LKVRRQQLADYLAGQASDIVEWRHELWRLEQMEASPGAQSVPHEQERIAEKRAETTAASSPWLAQVRAIERDLHDDLRDILNADQVNDPAVMESYDTLPADNQARSLHWMNIAITSLVIGVGVLLMLGLFTRLAAAGGILFLVSVLAAQPPWIAAPAGPIDPSYYQLVEIAGLMVLFASRAGRWAGLDYFISALTRRCCGR